MPSWSARIFRFCVIALGLNLVCCGVESCRAESRSSVVKGPTFESQSELAPQSEILGDAVPANPNFVPPVCIDPERPCRDHSIEFCKQFVPSYNCRLVAIPIIHPTLKGHLLNLTRKTLPNGETRYCLIEPQANVEVTCWNDSMHPSFDEMWIPERILKQLCEIYKRSNLGWECGEPLKHWIWTPEWFIEHCYPDYGHGENCKEPISGNYSSELK